MENSAKRTLLILLASVLVTGTVAFVYYNFSQKPQESFYQSLLEKNENFAYAEGLLKSQKFDEAAQNYKLALEDAEGFKEEGQLKYKVAISESEGSNPIEGVRLLKEVAANTSYTQTIRAYAVQYLGHLLYAINTEEINKEVFKDEPYKSFLSGSADDRSVARRKLYEYASSIYPLGIPELRIAKWYSQELVHISGPGAQGIASSTQVEEMKAIIRQKLASADSYVASIARDEQAGQYIPEVLYRKATVLGDLYISGDTSFGDPEQTYKQALTASTLRVGQESSAKFSYASYLARKYGAQRADDIKVLLKDFYAGDRYAKTNTVDMIRGEKNNLLGNKPYLLLLAKIDTNFATFLKSLGW